VIGISGGADETAGSLILKAYHDTYDDLGGYDAQIFAGLSLPASSWRLNCLVPCYSPRNGGSQTFWYPVQRK
jgi:hypothetical protein